MEVGDRIQINIRSKFLGQNRRIGIITSVRETVGIGEFRYSVAWYDKEGGPKHSSNSYRESDIFKTYKRSPAKAGDLILCEKVIFKVKSITSTDFHCYSVKNVSEQGAPVLINKNRDYLIVKI